MNAGSRYLALLFTAAGALTIAQPAAAYPMLLPTAQTHCVVVGTALNTVFVAVGGYFAGAANGSIMTFKFTNTQSGAVLTFTKNTKLLDPNGFPIPAGNWRIDVSAPSVGGKPVTITVPSYKRVGRVCVEMPDQHTDTVPVLRTPTTGGKSY